MTVVSANSQAKKVQDANSEYKSIVKAWSRARAVLGGESYVKAFDGAIDRFGFSNLLIPFSPSMQDPQYNFYKAEAEFPGITTEFARMIIGGLLRKEPTIKFGASITKEIQNWIRNEFGQDGAPLVTFLDTALWEEMQTSRCWVFVDYPKVDGELTPEQESKLNPYPVLYKAEDVINWAVGNDANGRKILKRVVVKTIVERENPDNEFHPDLVETVFVHEIVEGFYQIRKYELESISNTNVAVVNGQKLTPKATTSEFRLKDTYQNIKIKGQRVTIIPAWPLNGQIDIQTPLLMSFINKEVALYNKLSRRNHLLLGAATYTPYVVGDISDEKFKDIVDAGLGSWFKLPSGSEAGVLDTPTAALADMEKAIASNVEDLAKLGIRMLAPESTDQSGIALELRNASQTARIGSLANKISRIMEQIIRFMIFWKTGTLPATDEVEFQLSEDFNPAPLGDTWLRLVTEWYQQNLIPRSVWLALLKQNDLVPPDYDDAVGQVEIDKNISETLTRQVSVQTTLQKVAGNEGEV